MLSRVENLLPRPRDNSKSMDYIFPWFLQYKHPHLWQKKNTNSPVCDSNTTFEGLDHLHIWWLEKAATSTTPDLKILEGITPVEDMRELFGYETLDSASYLSEKPYINVLMVSFIY